MTLRLSGWPLLAAIAIALPLPAQAAKPGANASAISPTYARDLYDIIEAEHTYEYVFQSPLKQEMPADKRQFIEIFRRETTREEMVRRMTPGMAALFSPQLASRLARLMNTPVYRKYTDHYRLTPDEDLNFSAADEAEMLRIEKDPAMKTYVALTPKVEAVLSDAMKRWNIEFNEQLGMRAIAIIDKVESDLETARTKGDNRLVIIGSVGYAPLDRLINAIGGGLVTFTKAIDQLDEVKTRVGYTEYIGLNNLADRTRLAGASHVFDQVEDALEATLSDCSAALDEFAEGLDNPTLTNRPELRNRYVSQLTALRAFVSSYGEISRRINVQHREMMKFVQTNLHAIALTEGKLRYSQEDVRRRARELEKELDATYQELEDAGLRLSTR